MIKPVRSPSIIVFGRDTTLGEDAGLSLGRSIKTYSQTTMMSPSYHKVWVSSTATCPNSCTALALCTHCAKCDPFVLATVLAKLQ